MDDLPTLPDYLTPGLDLVSIGINPSLPAARAGFYCATPPGGTDSRHSRNHKPFSERTTSESVEVKTKGKAK